MKLRVVLSLLSVSAGAWCGVASSVAATNSDSALNLLDATDFFVCGAAVPGLDGRYVLSDEVQSDEHTPVYVREDDADDDGVDINAHDFRLYRHNGFWLLADVATWPPKTHFRCDPTKRDIEGVNTMEACSMYLGTPPRVGYSPVDPTQSTLELRGERCGSPLATPRAEL